MNFNQTIISLLIFIIPIGFSTSAFAQATKPIPPKNPSPEEAKKYDEAKRKWIKENPEEYIRMGGQITPGTEVPEKKTVITDTPKSQETPNNSISREDIPENVIKFKLNQLDIVDNEKNDEELSAEQKKFVDNFSKEHMVIYLDNSMKYVYISDGRGELKKLQLSIEDKTLVSKEELCDECEPTTLNVIEFNTKSIVVEQEQTNGHQTYIIRYNFKS